jgi:RNA polymerase sigma factor (sigma-70 family)
MDETTDRQEWLAEQFEGYRGRMRAVAYRMLGSLSEADDAIQEAWLHLSRSQSGGGSEANDPRPGIRNLGGYLTTVVARVCLDMLRSRTSRREEPLDALDALEAYLPEVDHLARLPDPIVSRLDAVDPEHEVLLADAVGLALQVVLETLAPAERLAFVLHDMFGVPFVEIAPIVGRSATAARQLASRARRRVRGQGTAHKQQEHQHGPAGTPAPEADLSRQRAVVDAFLAAARHGDFEGLLAMLDPQVVLRVDRGVVGAGAGARGGLLVLRGAQTVAEQARVFSRSAEFVQPVLVNGAAGIVSWLPGGRPFAIIGFTVRGGKLAEIDILADSARLRKLNIPCDR